MELSLPTQTRPRKNENPVSVISLGVRPQALMQWLTRHVRLLPVTVNQSQFSSHMAVEITQQCFHSQRRCMQSCATLKFSCRKLRSLSWMRASSDSSKEGWESETAIRFLSKLGLGLCYLLKKMIETQQIIQNLSELTCALEHNVVSITEIVRLWKMSRKLQRSRRTRMLTSGEASAWASDRSIWWGLNKATQSDTLHFSHIIFTMVLQAN